MATSRERNRLVCFAAVLASAGAVLIWADAAVASQGPGVAAGTASGLTQAIKAILVYGASGLVVGSGLIDALRQD
jgi:hypothetical protein